LHRKSVPFSVLFDLAVINTIKVHTFFVFYTIFGGAFLGHRASDFVLLAFPNARAVPLSLFFSLSLLILLFLNGCNSNETNEDLFEFKGSFVGDNNAIGSIVNQLPSGEYLNGFELKTKEEP
jgi:Domain of unknown function (DUF4825)